MAKAAKTTAEGETRELDIAAGGGTVPMGPLGGPEPKTREELLADMEPETPPPEAPVTAAAKKPSNAL